MSDPTDTPLIYTSRGNLPMDQLDYSTRWEDNPDFTKFVETYRYQGEVVRESAHVLTHQGLSFEAYATPLN
jgi:hypothetical protein